MSDNVVKMEDAQERKALLDKLQAAIESVLPDTYAFCLTVLEAHADGTTGLVTHHREPHPAHTFHIGNQIHALDEYYGQRCEAIVMEIVDKEPAEEELSGCDCPVCINVRKVRESRKPKILMPGQ